MWLQLLQADGPPSLYSNIYWTYVYVSLTSTSGGRAAIGSCLPAAEADASLWLNAQICCSPCLFALSSQCADCTDVTCWQLAVIVLLRQLTLTWSGCFSRVLPPLPLNYGRCDGDQQRVVSLAEFRLVVWTLLCVFASLFCVAQCRLLSVKSPTWNEGWTRWGNPSTSGVQSSSGETFRNTNSCGLVAQCLGPRSEHRWDVSIPNFPVGTSPSSLTSKQKWEERRWEEDYLSVTSPS